MTLFDILCEVGAQQQAEEQKLDMQRCDSGGGAAKTEKKKQSGAARPPRMAQAPLKTEIRVRSEAVQSGAPGREREREREGAIAILGAVPGAAKMKSSSGEMYDCEAGVERDQLRKDGQERASSPSGLSTESPNNIIGTLHPLERGRRKKLCPPLATRKKLTSFLSFLLFCT